MTTVREVLNKKGSMVYSVEPDTQVIEALKLLDEKDIGALVVLDNGELTGIISERDFVRNIARAEECDFYRPVQDYMTRKIVVVKPERSMEDCMAIMTRHHIRHLPVVDDTSRLIGLISIGDVVSNVIAWQESMIQGLENYIVGREQMR